MIGRLEIGRSRRFVPPVSFTVLLLFFALSPIPSVWAQTPSPEEAQIKIGRLSFGFTTGFYRPSLSSINSVLNDRTLAIMEDPNFLLPGNPEFRVEARNVPAGEFSGAPWVGLESQWELSDSFALRLMGGVWKGERSVEDPIITFLRSNLPQLVAPRNARYNITLNQFFLDWRYYLYNEPQKGRLSLDLGIIGITLGYLTLDSLTRVVHPAAPNGGFASISSSEASGLAYTGRYGMTGEYFLGKKMALGLTTHYVIGRITSLELTRYFPAGFPQVPVPEPLSIRAGVPLPVTPPQPQVGESISTAATVTAPNGVESFGPPRDLFLELDGIEVSGYVRFYF